MSRSGTYRKAVFNVVSPDDGGILAEVELSENRYRCRIREGFFLAMEDALQLIAALNLGNTEYRVLLGLLANMDYGNVVRIKQSVIAAKIGIKTSNFSKAMQRLKQLGLVLTEETEEGRMIRVSAALAWKGHANREFESIYHQDSKKLSRELQLLKQ